MRFLTALTVSALLTLSAKTILFAHCEVPCGIYDDRMRISMIEEHCTTIEKGMRQIIELSAQGESSANQLIRWTVNKEHHCNEVQHIVTQYFMTQRIKAVSPAESEAYKGYQKKLELLHGMLVSAMKAKQTTDVSHVAKLRSGLKEFSTAYFGGE